MGRVTVVGGGVVGLTAALRLAQAGHRVSCVRDLPVARTVSALAGGLWFPYHVEPRERVVGWGLVALERFTTLAADRATGVVMRQGLLLERFARTAGGPPGCRAGEEGGRVSCRPGRPVGSSPRCRWSPCRCSSRGSKS